MIRKKMNYYDIKRIVFVFCIFIFIFNLVLILSLNKTKKILIGIAGNKKGQFVVGYTLRSPDYAFLFFDENCNLIKTVNLEIRGHVVLGNYGENVGIWNTTGKYLLIYDSFGNYISKQDNSSKMERNYKIKESNYEIKYEQSEDWNEYIYYIKKDAIIKVDIQYDKYKKARKYNFILIYSSVLWIIFAVIKINEYIKKKNNANDNI